MAPYAPSTTASSPLERPSRPAMGRKPSLTTAERVTIAVLAEENYSVAAIAKRTGRSHNVLSGFLQNKEGYGKKKSPGRPRKMTPASERCFVRVASAGRSSARELRESLELPVSVGTVKNYLSCTAHMTFKKCQCAPSLTAAHKVKRIDWAPYHVTWSDGQWVRVLFSDEKTFCLDGPDGFHSYSHELRKELDLLSRRQRGGDGLMFWGAFSWHGKTALVQMKGRQTTATNLKLLEETMLPFADYNLSLTWIYQQDNASIHVSHDAMD